MPRGLPIPGRGTQATCYKEVGWREVGRAGVPPRGVKLPEARVPSPARGPQLQGQVPAKAPPAEAHHHCNQQGNAHSLTGCRTLAGRVGKGLDGFSG